MTKISAKYFDYADISFLDLNIELSGNIGMNEHTIKLIDKEQSFYGSIYALSLVELETLKLYIKTYPKRVLFDLLSFLLGPPSFLIRSRIVASAYILIIKA